MAAQQWYDQEALIETTRKQGGADYWGRIWHGSNTCQGVCGARGGSGD